MLAPDKVSVHPSPGTAFALLGISETRVSRSVPRVGTCHFPAAGLGDVTRAAGFAPAAQGGGEQRANTSVQVAARLLAWAAVCAMGLVLARVTMASEVWLANSTAPDRHSCAKCAPIMACAHRLPPVPATPTSRLASFPVQAATGAHADYSARRVKYSAQMKFSAAATANAENLQAQPLRSHPANAKTTSMVHHVPSSAQYPSANRKLGSSDPSATSTLVCASVSELTRGCGMVKSATRALLASGAMSAMLLATATLAAFAAEMLGSARASTTIRMGTGQAKGASAARPGSLATSARRSMLNLSSCKHQPSR